MTIGKAIKWIFWGVVLLVGTPILINALQESKTDRAALDKRGVEVPGIIKFGGRFNQIVDVHRYRYEVRVVFSTQEGQTIRDSFIVTEDFIRAHFTNLGAETPSKPEVRVVYDPMDPTNARLVGAMEYRNFTRVYLVITAVAVALFFLYLRKQKS